MSRHLAARIPSAATDPAALPQRPCDRRWPPTVPLVIAGPLLFVALLNAYLNPKNRYSQ